MDDLTGGGLVGGLGQSLRDVAGPKHLGLDSLMQMLAPDSDYGTSTSSQAMDSGDHQNYADQMVQEQAQMSTMDGQNGMDPNQNPDVLSTDPSKKDMIMEVLAQRAQERRARGEMFQEKVRQMNKM